MYKFKVNDRVRVKSDEEVMKFIEDNPELFEKVKLNSYPGFDSFTSRGFTITRIDGYGTYPIKATKQRRTSGSLQTEYSFGWWELIPENYEVKLYKQLLK